MHVQSGPAVTSCMDVVWVRTKYLQIIGGTCCTQYEVGLHSLIYTGKHKQSELGIVNEQYLERST